MLKAQDFRNLSVDELEVKYEELCKELFTFGNQARVSDKSEEKHKVPRTRKQIARLLTVMSEKKRGVRA